jgi:glycosyltransferase involved in cell wall biosynthesis
MGYVETLDPVFAKCRATVVPLRYGAGLKGKIISSLSYCVPCVSTTIGVEGSGLKHEQQVLVGDSPENIADAILRLFKDDNLWQQLSDNGRDYFKKNFSTKAVFPKIRKLLQQLEVYSDEH